MGINKKCLCPIRNICGYLNETKAQNQMSTKLLEILEFLHRCYATYEQKRGKGRPFVYTHASMTLFFMVMALKRIYTFKGMTKYAKVHYEDFGFPRAPSRKTIRRRFLSLPRTIHWLLPEIVRQCQELDYATFRCSWAFVDKSVFRALGGLWHKKQMIAGIVPHPSIDTDASWSKSAYHGWRFGYGLHLVCLQNRFPVAGWVTTASLKDHTQLIQLLQPIRQMVGIVVGDAGYRCLQVIRLLHEDYGILLQTPKAFTTYVKQPFVKWYNAMIQLAEARWLYRRRKPAIEPLFSLIKQLFDLQGEKQLPYKGIDKVSAFLMIGPLTVQLMMRDNFIHNREWASNEAFLNHFK